MDAYGEFLEAEPPFGLMVAGRLGSAAVRHVVPGSPAAVADLNAWDVIEQIDGVYTRGRPLWQVRLGLREQLLAEEPVVLTVVDRTMEDRREVTLNPQTWVAEPIVLEDRNDVRIITVQSLPSGAAAQIESALAWDGPVVVDLRKLVWGRPVEALAVADLFAADGVLGAWKGRRAGAKEYRAEASTVASTLPVTLVGYDTEFAGEILADALRRLGAQLVGQATAGHAPHMRLIKAGDVHLWMPVARWLRADGEIIDGNGIEPDEVIEPGEEGSTDDPVLERAMEIVVSDVPLAAAA